MVELSALHGTIALLISSLTGIGIVFGYIRHILNTIRRIARVIKECAEALVAGEDLLTEITDSFEEHSAGGKELTVDEVREIHIKLKTSQKEFHDCYRILQSLRTQVWGD